HLGGQVPQPVTVAPVWLGKPSRSQLRARTAKQTGSAQFLPPPLAGRTRGPVFWVAAGQPAPSLALTGPHQRAGPALVPASGRTVSRAHRMDTAPAAPLGPHPRPRGRHHPP